MNNKIGKRELSRLKKFETTILNLKGENAPRYSVDYEMEARIKFDVLVENFGEKEVYEALNNLEIIKDDLSDHPTYLDIYGYLEAKKNQTN